MIHWRGAMHTILQYVYGCKDMFAYFKQKIDILDIVAALFAHTFFMTTLFSWHILWLLANYCKRRGK